MLGPARGGAGPAAAAAAGAARGRRPVVRRHPTRRAGAPPGPDHGGRARDARTARRAPPGRPDPRGPAPRRCRDPGARDVPRPDRRRPAARRSSPRTSRTSSRATTRGSPRWRPSPTRRVRRSGSTLPLLDRDELAALIEGIEGERTSASLLLLVAERSGGSPLVAEELLAARRELPTASLVRLARRARRRPARHPLGRVPPRAPAARAGRPPDGPGAARPDRGRLRDRHVAAGAAVDHLARAAGTGSSTRT